MPARKRILVAPLDWGLGHATRCIPIIKEIITLGHEAVIATDGRAYDLLKAEFPEVKLIRLKGYNPVYPSNGNMVFKMALQVPKFLFAIAREHYQLRKIIREYSIDAVISDNRYGLFSNKRPSVLITHQIFIKMPAHVKWIEPRVNRLNHFFIKQFYRCWVPDEEGDENLGGDLSHGFDLPDNVKYIGLLKRWTAAQIQSENGGTKYALLILLSGPEPQRTLLEKEIKQQLPQLKLKTLLVRGVAEEDRIERLDELTESVSVLTTGKLLEALKHSEVVVCRAGYSSLMELVSLQKNAVIIPTPGQTEQEFLAERCFKKNYFFTQKQSAINLKEAIKNLQETTVPKISDNTVLQTALQQLIGAS